MRDLIIHVAAVLAIALISVLTIRCAVSLWKHDDVKRLIEEGNKNGGTTAHLNM